jgi:hypothetical protein
MAATKRTPAQIDADRVEIARRYLRGETQAAIAVVLRTTRQMVGYDLAAVIVQWRASSLRDITQAKAEELARINHLEVTYWQAWEDSREDKEIATQKQSGAGDATKKEVSLRKEGQAGSPAFLAGVQWCIERRCHLLGLDAPIKLEQSGDVTVKILRGVSMDEL